MNPRVLLPLGFTAVATLVTYGLILDEAVLWPFCALLLATYVSYGMVMVVYPAWCVRRPPPPSEDPELEQLVAKVGLDINRIRVRSDARHTVSLGTARWGGIIWLAEEDKKHREAILAHELTHLRHHHPLLLLAFEPLFAWAYLASLLLLVLLLAFPETLEAPLAELLRQSLAKKLSPEQLAELSRSFIEDFHSDYRLGVALVTLLVLMHVAGIQRWFHQSMEFQADAGAVRLTGEDKVVRALPATDTVKSVPVASHPSTATRRDAVERRQAPRSYSRPFSPVGFFWGTLVLMAGGFLLGTLFIMSWHLQRQLTKLTHTVEQIEAQLGIENEQLAEAERLSRNLRVGLHAAHTSLGWSPDGGVAQDKGLWALQREAVDISKRLSNEASPLTRGLFTTREELGYLKDGGLDSKGTIPVLKESFKNLSDGLQASGEQLGLPADGGVTQDGALGRVVSASQALSQGLEGAPTSLGLQPDGGISLGSGHLGRLVQRTETLSTSLDSAARALEPLQHTEKMELSSCEDEEALSRMGLPARMKCLDHLTRALASVQQERLALARKKLEKEKEEPPARAERQLSTEDAGISTDAPDAGAPDDGRMPPDSTESPLESVSEKEG
ncbi:M48 family metalloprotease [Pyxidicoccus sp. 3LG]